MRRVSTAAATASLVGAAVVAGFIALPLTGGPPVVRVAPILLLGSLIVLCSARPWRWSTEQWARVGDWNPSARVLWIAAITVGLLLFWFVLTRFRSGQINAIDFTVYYDRPNFQTLLGRPLFIESADDPLRAYRSYFAVHAHWIMLPLAVFYAAWATPLWALALSVVAVVAGGIYTLRIIQAAGGGGLLGSAGALSFVLNDNTARTLNYGFHAEVLYAWFIPWMIYSGLTRRWAGFALASIACVAVKEDAFLPVFAVAVVLLLTTGRSLTRREWLYVAAPTAIALLNLVLYYRLLVPRLSATGAPFYANYWANYGPTAGTALMGMVRRPWEVVLATIGSGFLPRVMLPHLFLPFVGWRWFVGIVPVVLLYGSSANEQLRSFRIYYSIVLVPFLVLGAAFGADRCARLLVRNVQQARAVAGLLLVGGALVAGISNAGYSFRPWRHEIASLPSVLEAIGSQQPILVQSALYPHAGYSAHVQLLTNDSMSDPRYAGAVLVLAPELGAYPLSRQDIASLVSLRPAIDTPDGLIAVKR